MRLGHAFTGEDVADLADADDADAASESAFKTVRGGFIE